MTKNAMLMWAGGKESALTYKKLLEAGYNVVKLAVLTDEGKGVYNEKLMGIRTQRNYVPLEIIQAQADSLGVDLITIPITDITSLSEYYNSLNEWAVKCQTAYKEFKQQGGTHVAFGYYDSMCLESKNVGVAGLEVLYPLIDMTESQIVEELIQNNFKCKVVRTSPTVTGIPAYSDFCGKDWGYDVVQKCLELGISTIGEDGGFGTVCYEAPIYSNSIPIKVDEVITFDVDELLSTAKLSDMNAFNVLQLGAKRTFANISL